MKIASGAGMWPAFWALGNGKWPDCGEIDMMETVGDSSWVSNALHGPNYFGDTPLVYRYSFPANTNVDQWHVYSLDWTPDKIVFKTDDKVTYMVTRAMVEHYGRWAFAELTEIYQIESDFAAKVKGAFDSMIATTTTPSA